MPDILNLKQITVESFKTGEKIKLDDKTQKAKGGEGIVHIVGNKGYKICFDGKMIPRKKFEELNVIQKDNIIVPTDILLYRGKDIGYSFKAVPDNPVTLAEMMTKPYRKRENITPEMMAKLALKYTGNVHHIHKHDGFLMVDGNEFNAMVPETYDDIYFIDTNSYQTPSYPAEVIMPSIRDWHVEKKNGVYVFTKESDWYSAAIVTFYMFTAMHAFRGNHPRFTDKKTFMVENMKHCFSVFNENVKFPKGPVYYPFEDYIPGGKDGAWMQWYKSIFVDNKRLPAPESFQASIKLVMKIKEIIGSDNFAMKELFEFSSAITGYFRCPNRDVVLTKENLHIGKRTVPRMAKRVHVGFTPKKSIPFAAWIENDKLKLMNLDTKANVDVNVSIKKLMSTEGRVYGLGENHVYEVSFAEVANKIIATPVVAASVMGNATTLYHGAAIQDNFGKKIVSLFTASKQHNQFLIKELEAYKITDAKYEDGILMVVGYNNKEDQYDRMVIRFDREWKEYEIRKVENINPSGINFTVLPNGTCISINEEEKIEMFSTRIGSTSLQTIDDPAITMDMHLCRQSDQVKFARDNKLYSFSMKKK